MRNTKDYKEMQEILRDIKSSSIIREMKKYKQHGKVSTYEHCKNVAKLSYDINRKFLLHADLRVLLLGAMLHDFYLYDWHNEDDGKHKLHGFTHAERARDNAMKYFDIDEKTGHVIYCHMWPLNLRRVPKTKEAWIVCIADKCVSLYETVFRR
ncbi:HD domain-containing protein [Lachnospiraceae bacterium C1.1]|nr:HD domain-containing protein [Lachnospiraceae bacterium C1.1]